MNAIDISTDNATDNVAQELTPEQFFESPEQQGRIRFAVLDRTGDTRHSWDPAKPAEVAAARSMFESLRAGGYDAFRIAAGKKNEQGELAREFDPSHGAYLFTPRMVGG